MKTTSHLPTPQVRIHASPRFFDPRRQATIDRRTGQVVR